RRRPLLRALAASGRKLSVQQRAARPLRPGGGGDFRSHRGHLAQRRPRGVQGGRGGSTTRVEKRRRHADRTMNKWPAIGLTILLPLGGLGAAAYVWLHWPPPVPEIPLEGQEPEVVDVVGRARAAVVKDPRSADAWGQLGRVLMANELHSEIALDCFAQAERLDPNNPRWPYFCAGILKVDKGKPEEAVRKLERAVALADAGGVPPSAPRLLLAETLLSLGRADDAEVHFKHVS